jgi:hypothetical protein
VLEAVVGSDGKGGLINKSIDEAILKNHGDAYMQQCGTVKLDEDMTRRLRSLQKFERVAG